MNAGMDRREFLGVSMAVGALLVVGEATQTKAMAQGIGRISEAEQATIWFLTDNYYDANRADTKITKRYRSLPGKSMHAEHGLSFYIQTVVDGKASVCMFDYGLDPSGVINNAALLGLDLAKPNAFGLSHGHYDHFTGAVTIFKQNQGRIAGGTPFYVGEEAFAHRYSVRPGNPEPQDLGQLRREDIEALGLKVVEISEPTEIIPGVYSTGKIARVTPYEKIPPTFLIDRDAKRESDDFRGEQALFLNIKGKGLVVLSGCAHSGIVNAVKQAQKIAGTDRLHAVMGGFHLINAKPEIIQKTVADIKAMGPDHIVPAHCTGFEAIVLFSREMPDQFTINTAGTQYNFPA